MHLKNITQLFHTDFLSFIWDIQSTKRILNITATILFLAFLGICVRKWRHENWIQCPPFPRNVVQHFFLNWTWKYYRWFCVVKICCFECFKKKEIKFYFILFSRKSEIKKNTKSLKKYYKRHFVKIYILFIPLP